MVLKKRKGKGFATAEIIVALTVVGFIMAAMVVSLHEYGQFNHYQMARQRCIAAAQAQLDSIATRTRTIADAELARLWPGVTVAIAKTEGAGRWQGLQLVRVTAAAPSGHRQVKVELCRFVVSPGQTVPVKEQ